MLIGLTLLVIALTVFIVQGPKGKWAMFSLLWRSSTPPVNNNNQASSADDRNKRRAAREEKADTSNGDQSRRRRSSSPTDGTNSPDGTPKARPASNGVLPAVPSFSLHTGEDNTSEDEDDHMPPPSFPALNSAQRASAPSTLRKPPALKPLSNGSAQHTPSQLMPPPPRLPQMRPPPPPSASASLRIPSSGPLPNRGPPTSGSSSLAVPPSSATKTPNPRQKVLLKPGHSPLDWAHLQKSSTNLSGVDRLVRVTPSMLKAKNGRKGRPAWSSYQGKVYNITPYLPYHPGGEGELRRAAGKDGEKLFMEVHPWVNWENMLGECLVGIMVSEGDVGARESALDDMD